MSRVMRWVFGVVGALFLVVLLVTGVLGAMLNLLLAVDGLLLRTFLAV